MASKHRVQHSALTSGTLFDELEDQDGDASQHTLAEAERLILDLADYVYAHTSLKPISKTLFLLSRCLFVAKLGGAASTAPDLCSKYSRLRSSLNGAGPDDDYDFSAVVKECEQHLPRILDAVSRICQLTIKTDSLGLVFNTLLRGKFEGGEGMGTFLTPEEVVFPMVDMLLKVVNEHDLAHIGGPSPLYYGDVCGGTGRFVYALSRRLEQHGVARQRLEKAARLFDQSSLAVDLGRLNFLFEGMKPTFHRVGDSLVAPEVSKLEGRFLALATNPPFGSGKYRWNREIAESLPCEVLASVGMRSQSDAADPSALFFFRNLDLLAPRGVLAIVLPDGLVQSDGFRCALSAYERTRQTRLHLAAVVSLPSTTFSLGGTVAKTSFLVVQKQEEKDGRPMYVAVAHHVGFIKRGKKRAKDPEGNDLAQIAQEFGASAPLVGRTAANWREHDSLIATRMMHSAERESPRLKETRLPDLVKVVRDFANGDAHAAEPRFHVSVLDVDSTGMIDIIAASSNEPMSKGLCCRPGDILLCCINPKIWRVTVIPNLGGSWTCSSEFVVLRPKKSGCSWRLAVALHHPRVTRAVQAMAKGTSSSRQRVAKDRVLSISVPDVDTGEDLASYIAWREDFYRKRLKEARAYGRVHDGESRFAW
jgi:hypothetical protein